MNKIINTFLLEGNIFTPETQLKQDGFTYNTCGPLLKTQKEYKKLKMQFKEDSRYI